MKSMPKFEQMKNNVELTITNEGLRVELIESEKGMFFESGNFKPTDQGKALLVELATELGRLPNTIVIEGYTDAKPYQGQNAYTNWELSADRANAARRLMQESGLRADQVKQVRGFADQRLRTPKDPEAPSNRRVSVIVQYQDAAGGSAASGRQVPAAPHAAAPQPTATQPLPKTAAAH
jgi:chemotaxis protein MotB